MDTFSSFWRDRNVSQKHVWRAKIADAFLDYNKRGYWRSFWPSVVAQMSENRTEANIVDRWM
jgi:hypothetical protein